LASPLFQFDFIPGFGLDSGEVITEHCCGLGSTLPTIGLCVHPAIPGVLDATWRSIWLHELEQRSGVRHWFVATPTDNQDANAADDGERRSGERRGDVDRRTHDSGAPDGVERRKRERRKGERRAKKEKPGK
jgi:hypothetical protein